MVAPNGERMRIHIAVYGVAGEQPAKEQNFRGQETPDPEPGGVVLLFQRVKLFRWKSSTAWHAAPPFPPVLVCNRKVHGPPPVFDESYGPVEERVFATPDPLHSMG